MRRALPPLREVIARHGIAAQRRLGQNFLLDLNLTRRIARAGGAARRRHGHRDRRRPRRADPRAAWRGAPACHRDRARPALPRRARRARRGLSRAACRSSPATRWRSTRRALTHAPRKIVANLPYNIATALLLGWLDRIREYRELDPDVSARGRPAARRGAAQQAVWAPRRCWPSGSPRRRSCSTCRPAPSCRRPR